MPRKIEIDPKIVVAAICQTTGISFNKAIEGCRKREFSLTRQLIVYYLTFCGWTWVSIAQFLGGKDHTTIIKNFSTISGLLSSGDEAVVDAVLTIDNILFPEA